MADSVPSHGKTVFILEHLDDVREYRNIHKNIGGTHILIAATPDACWELEKQKIPFRGIEQYYDPDEIYALGRDNYQKIDRLCSDIDSMLWEYYPLLKKTGFNPAKDNFFYFKILYDNLTLRIHIIQTIFRNEKPDCIITFSSFTNGQETHKTQDLPFDVSDSVYSILLNMKGWTCKTEQLNRSNLPVDREKALSNFFIMPFLINKLKKHPIFFIPLFSLKNFGFVKTLKIIFYLGRNAGRRQKSLFLLRQEPSWSSVIFHLYQEGYQLFYLPEKNDISLTEPVLGNELGGKLAACLHPFAIYQNIDFFDVLNDHFLNKILYYFQSMPNIVEKTEEYIHRYHPVAFLCSEKSTFIEHIYAHIAQHHQIPVIAWQHGDGPFFPPMQLFVEVMNSDIHLSYGPGHQKMLCAAPENHFNCRIESVGSCILENLYSTTTESAAGNKILYVTTGYYYNNLYVNSYPIHDNVLWSCQKEILRLFGDLAVPVVFKLSPGQYGNPFIFEYIQKNHFDNITIIRNERTFLELLKDTDVVICDYPATPVIEAIAAKKTVFVLLNSPYLREEALTPLKKRVFWSDTIEDFVRMLSDYLNEKPLNQHPDLHNTEYLETFGVHKLDGNVAQRALTILGREIKNQD